jgi:serine/threonine-protein kinase
MVYRMSHDDRVDAFNPEDGDIVDDDELLSGSRPDASGRPDAYPTRAPRASERVSRPPSRDPLEGEILAGRYQVERLVARTAHEVLLHARHLELGQRVSLRYLTPEAARSPEAVARFQRGARQARELRSENAERVLDFGRLEARNPYRASELPNGPSVAEIVRVRGALPVTEAVGIVMAACEPVAEAHAMGMVHRSLNPFNIYIERRPDGSPLVRVLDFGVADPLEPDWGDDTSVRGPSATSESLPYAAPEQIRSPGRVDARVDVWALGVILYELLAGARLFQADSPLSLLAMISADSPTPLHVLRSDVPPDLETIVLACLEKDPEGRPRSVVDLVLALVAFASPEAQPAAARVARIVTRTTRPPPFPSLAPHSFVPPSRNPGALVHTPAPSRAASQMFTVNAPETRGWGMLFAGAGIGVCAALLTTILMRPATPVVTNADAPKAAARLEPTSSPAVALAPVAPAPSLPLAAPTTLPAPASPPGPAAPVIGAQSPSTAVLTAPPAAPAAVAAAPTAAAPTPPVRPPAARPRVHMPSSAQVAPKPDANAKKASDDERSEPKPTAAADLFSGMD